MYWRQKDFRAAQEREGAPSKLTQVLTQSSLDLFRINLLTCLAMIPVVTIPAALCAMNEMAGRMVQDEGASPRRFWASVKGHLLRGIPVFLLACVLPWVAAGAAFLYAGMTGEQGLFFVPCVICLLMCLVSLLTSAYLFPLSAAMPLKQAIPASVGLALARPGRALVCGVLNHGLMFLAIAFLPLSGPYFLLGGLAFPCLVGQFLVRENVQLILPLREAPEGAEEEQ